MSMHPSTFQYLKPSDTQLNEMQVAREAVDQCSRTLDAVVPDGPDKTYLMRKLREVGMWANVAITRNADGAPRV